MIYNHTMRFCADMFGFAGDDDDEPTDVTPIAPVNPDDDSSSAGGSSVSSSFLKKALLISKKPWDCSNKSAVTGFVFGGVEPSGTRRRFMFIIDDKVRRFTGEGSVMEEVTGELTVDKVLSKGNTVRYMSTLTDIPPFVGKKIYPVIALRAPSDAEDLPAASIKLKAVSSSDVLTSSVESIVFDLTAEEFVPRIISLTPDVTLKGSASVDIKIRLRVNSVWSSYMTLNEAVEQEAQAVQFKITYKVTKNDGSDSCKVNSVTVEHTMGKTVVSGSDADLYSVVADYETDLKTCYMVVRHAPLGESKLEAYVNFMGAPSHRELVSIGTGTGTTQEIKLSDEGIIASSIEIYYDGMRLTNFSYNSDTATVTLKVLKNRVLAASYDYNRGAELWRKMTKETTEPYNDATGSCLTRFTYSLPADESSPSSVSNVRLKMIRPSGSVSNGSLGAATGKKQMFVLRHVPLAASISFSESSVDFTYNEDNNILTLSAPKNTPLRCSYKWQAEEINVYSFAAGWVPV